MSELLEKILSKDNMNAAYKRVCANKGAGGVDEVTIEELGDYIKENWESIRNQIRCREYKPQPVRRVEIPKASGGVRKLGIPTVKDRIVQMAAKIAIFVIIYIITMLSVHKPAKIAGNVSPMEALRYVPQDGMKQTSGRKQCRDLTPAGLGIMNFSRNRNVCGNSHGREVLPWKSIFSARSEIPEGEK